MKDKINVRSEELQIFIVPVDNSKDIKKVNLASKAKRKPKYKWKLD